MVSVGISRGGDGLVCTSWAQTRLVMLAANPELNLLLSPKVASKQVTLLSCSGGRIEEKGKELSLPSGSM
jgi:hypothetical protein